MKLIIFIGCETGFIGELGPVKERLPSVAVEQGATVAIGFEGDVDCKKANEWLIALFNKLKAGDQIGIACANLANSSDYRGSGLDTVAVFGDGTATFN